MMGNASQCEKSRSAEGRYQGVPVSLGSCQMTSSEENKHVTAKKKKKKLIFEIVHTCLKAHPSSVYGEHHEINLRTVSGRTKI